MDDESKHLLSEILATLRESSEREAAWHEEMRATIRRQRRLVGLMLILLLLLVVGMIGWSMLSSLNPPSEIEPPSRPTPIPTY